MGRARASQGAALGACAVAVLVLLAVGSRGRSVTLLQPAAGPLRKGAMVSMDVPAAQLATAKIGDIVQGQMKAAGGEVAFTGKVAGGSQVSEATGAVTIRVLSDKYIQPGTAVSGRVGNAMFKGTVAQSPSEQERLADMEKRLASLEEPAQGDIANIHHTLNDFDGRLRTLEGSKTMEERVDELQHKIADLENQKPGLDYRLIKNNREGFHFHGSIGPNELEPSLDKVEQNLADVEKGPDVQEVVEPISVRLHEIEERINDISDSVKPQDKMAKLEKRLAALQKQAMDDDHKAV